MLLKTIAVMQMGTAAAWETYKYVIEYVITTTVPGAN